MSRSEAQELLACGSVHTSPGGQYSFRVIGPCCRLFDREELPWPCCRLAWRSKEPSWRRVGRRFVPDLAARRCPSYAVELLQPGSPTPRKSSTEPFTSIGIRWKTTPLGVVFCCLSVFHEFIAELST